jgi:phosphatidylglycerophosphate synthase
MTHQPLDKDRRPIKSRNTQWAQKFTSYLVKINASPNKISVWSIFFAIVGALAIWLIPNQGGVWILALCVLLRLLCNLFDGMVAIELNQPNPLGRIYNEFPDRITDTIFIVAVGFACNQLVLSVFGAMFAVATAYIRIFGGSLGFEQDFRGPQSKSQRMGVMIGTCVLGQIELWLNGSFYCLTIGMWIITLGSLLTCVTRTIALKNKILEQEGAKNAS